MAGVGPLILPMTSMISTSYESSANHERASLPENTGFTRQPSYSKASANGCHLMSSSSAINRWTFISLLGCEGRYGSGIARQE